jgi:hypothetical protein
MSGNFGQSSYQTLKAAITNRQHVTCHYHGHVRKGCESSAVLSLARRVTAVIKKSHGDILQ